MFTGIVTDVGVIVGIEDIPAGRHLRIRTAFRPDTLETGCSIACSGVCLTVDDKGEDADGRWFSVVTARQTLQVTTAGGWQKGARINLERALPATGRLDGHIVQGHVDGVARILARHDGPQAIEYVLRAPPELARFIAIRGSVTLDGTSLTVNQVTGCDFSVFLIPHTISHTNWDDRRCDDRVNLEVDILARYVARLGEVPAQGPSEAPEQGPSSDSTE